MQNNQSDGDDGMPPPQEELSTPQPKQLQQQSRVNLDAFSTPISSRRPAPIHQMALEEEDEDSYISYDATSVAASGDYDVKENALPELRTPTLPSSTGQRAFVNAAAAPANGNLVRSAPGNAKTSMNPFVNSVPQNSLISELKLQMKTLDILHICLLPLKWLALKSLMNGVDFFILLPLFLAMETSC